jgi:hypothetical protein
VTHPGRLQIGMVAAFKSEWVAAFKSEPPAGFIGIRKRLLRFDPRGSIAVARTAEIGAPRPLPDGLPKVS